MLRLRMREYHARERRRDGEDDVLGWIGLPEEGCQQPILPNRGVYDCDGRDGGVGDWVDVFNRAGRIAERDWCRGCRAKGEVDGMGYIRYY